MSQVTKEQELQNSVIELKARLYDAHEMAGAAQAQAKQFGEALAAIAGLVGIQGDSVELNSIVEAVKALLPAQGELDVEAE